MACGDNEAYINSKKRRSRCFLAFLCLYNEITGSTTPFVICLAAFAGAARTVLEFAVVDCRREWNKGMDYFVNGLVFERIYFV